MRNVGRAVVDRVVYVDVGCAVDRAVRKKVGLAVTGVYLAVNWAVDGALRTAKFTADPHPNLERFLNEVHAMRGATLE